MSWSIDIPESVINYTPLEDREYKRNGYHRIQDHRETQPFPVLNSRNQNKVIQNAITHHHTIEPKATLSHISVTCISIFTWYHDRMISVIAFSFIHVSSHTDVFNKKKVI